MCDIMSIKFVDGFLLLKSGMEHFNALSIHCPQEFFLIC